VLYFEILKNTSTGKRKMISARERVIIMSHVKVELANWRDSCKDTLVRRRMRIGGKTLIIKIVNRPEQTITKDVPK